MLRSKQRWWWPAVVVLIALPGAGCGRLTPPNPVATATTAPVAITATPVAAVAIPSPPQEGETVTIIRVTDGDTIEVRRADGTTARVRYIGVNTPETVDPRRPVQCYGREAAERNRELVTGRTALLERDISETDGYGRLLRYVWVEGRMVNALLVRDGFGHATSFPPDVKYLDVLRALDREARAERRGLWGSCVGN